MLYVISFEVFIRQCSVAVLLSYILLTPLFWAYVFCLAGGSLMKARVTVCLNVAFRLPSPRPEGRSVKSLGGWNGSCTNADQIRQWILSFLRYSDCLDLRYDSLYCAMLDSIPWRHGGVAPWILNPSLAYSAQGHHHYSVVRLGKGPWFFQSEFFRQDDLVLPLSVSRHSTLRSSSSCSRLLLRRPLASNIPSIFPSLTCFKRRVLSRCDQSS